MLGKTQYEEKLKENKENPACAEVLWEETPPEHTPAAPCSPRLLPQPPALPNALALSFCHSACDKLKA